MKKLIMITGLLIAESINLTAQQSMEKITVWNHHGDLYGATLLANKKISTDGSFEKYRFRIMTVMQYPSRRPALQPEHLSPDFYYATCYGFFCKIEWMTQQKWHIPLSFRLGSREYVNKLEGKE